MQAPCSPLMQACGGDGGTGEHRATSSQVAGVQISRLSARKNSGRIPQPFAAAAPPAAPGHKMATVLKPLEKLRSRYKQPGTRGHSTLHPHRAEGRTFPSPDRGEVNKAWFYFLFLRHWLPFSLREEFLKSTHSLFLPLTQQNTPCELHGTSLPSPDLTGKIIP